jgi:hypothetical protein
MVRRDVAEGFISLKRAKTEYGVVIDLETGGVDETATAAVRQKQIG